MIHAEFLKTKDQVVGFQISGHSGASEKGTDIVCAAVSSAAYMTANTITDIIGVSAKIAVKDGLMFFQIPYKSSAECCYVLNGFRLHMKALKAQYPNHIEITDTEV